MLYHCSIVNGRLAIMDQSGFPKIDTYIQPDEAECKYLTEQLKIDKYTLDSAQDPAETPRVEFEKEHISIILKYPQTYAEKDELHFNINSIGMFIFSPGYIVFILNEVLSTERIRGSREGVTVEYLKTAPDVLLRVLSQSIRHFEINLKRISKRKDELKKSIASPQRHKNLMDMFTLREGLIYYIDALRGNGYLIERILSVSEKFNFTRENIESLKDYAIENQQFLEQAQVYSQILSDLMDTCNSIISNNLNIIMKNMNSMVLAIAVPTFFTGLGGMSEFTAMTAPYIEWYVAYPLFFSLMILLAGLVYCLLQRYYRT